MSPPPRTDLEGMVSTAHGVPLLRFFTDHPEIDCGLSMRGGGVSSAPFDDLNLGGSTADRKEAVTENRRRFYRAAGLDPEAVARMHQVHGGRVITVERSGDVGEADGLVTGRAGLPLLVTVADCLPVFFADLQAGVVGVVHAGWRGILAGVLEAGIEAAMAKGATADRIEVELGPGIGSCCFEVGPDVAERFDPVTRRPGRGERPHVDLAAAVRLRLGQAGIGSQAIHGPPACTRCRSDLFFSSRAGEPTGRMVGFILRRKGHSQPS